MSDSNQKKRALVVEDEAVAKTFLVKLLEEQGFETTACENGALGLLHFFRDEPYDVVLLDLMMPEVDGLEFLRIVECLYEREAISGPARVIVQSGISNYALLAKLVNYQCVHAVRSKPLSKAELIKDIDTLFNA